MLTDATGMGGTPSWMELFPTGGPPLGRELGTVVYAPGSNRIIVFGGCSANCGSALSDVWVLSNANAIGGTPTWTQLFPSGAFGREEHAAVYDPGSNRMMVFGGALAFFETDQNDVRVLTNADGTGGAPAWIQLAPSGTPPAARRSWQTAAYDQANNRLILFGGLSGATFALGRVGQAFSFDGVDDYVEVPHDASLDIGTGFTFDAWIKADNSQSNQSNLWAIVDEAHRDPGIGWACHGVENVFTPPGFPGNRATVPGRFSVPSAAAARSRWSGPRRT